MKLMLTVGLLILTQCLAAQTFTEVHTFRQEKFYQFSLFSTIANRGSFQNHYEK